MKQEVYYGKRLKVPSMVQVRHELRAFIAEYNVREFCAEADGLAPNATWKEIEAHRATVSSARDGE
ncbi:MAG TPA: hypothetical protein VJ476_13550 [Rhizomicrobium sp.]|nr:hypothetical protein [Rhizomicrobium sp.]